MNKKLPPPRQGRLKERSVTTIYMVFLGVVFVVGGVFLAYYFKGNPDILFSSRQVKAPSRQIIHLPVGDVDLFIKKYMLAKVKRSPLRKIQYVRVYIPLKQNEETVSFAENTDLDKWVLATITKQKARFSKRKWVKEIFRIYYKGPGVSHASGLIQYNFKPASPYENMELFVDNLDNPAILIKCDLQSSSLGFRMCEVERRISKTLSIFYRFPKQRLETWREIRTAVRQFVSQTVKPAS